MSDDGSCGLPARPGRASGDWVAIVGWPLPAVVLAAANAALAIPMLTRLHLVHAATMPSLWRISLLLPVPLIGGIVIARRMEAGLLMPGWRASVQIPVLTAAALVSAVTFCFWRAGGLLPWWVSGLVLLLPCGYACASSVTLQLRPGQGFWPWLRPLAAPVLAVGIGQAILIVGVTIAAQPGFDSKFLGLITALVGGRALLSALRTGRRLIAIERSRAPLRVRARLSDLIDPR